jgi:predicted  nucleic acid-binding Zn-ribbon protein
MEQLMALGVIPGDPDSAAKAFADLKAKLAKEKAAREIAQTKVETLTQAVEDLKISIDRFTAQIPTLEEKVKHLGNKVLDDDYKSQNARLTKKLESKPPLSGKPWLMLDILP